MYKRHCDLVSVKFKVKCSLDFLPLWNLKLTIKLGEIELQSLNQTLSHSQFIALQQNAGSRMVMCISAITHSYLLILLDYIIIIITDPPIIDLHLLSLSVSCQAQELFAYIKQWLEILYIWVVLRKCHFCDMIWIIILKFKC